MNWITSGNRKVHQRALNKAVRAVNEVIAKDDVWRGRFVIRQVGAEWMPDEDGARCLVAILEYRDKKTGYSSTFIGTINRLVNFKGFTLMERMNYFITEECNVWVKEGHAAIMADKTDYTKLA